MGALSRPRHNARELVANGALLLDVRTAAEFGEQHIPGALNIPVQELPGRVGELLRTTHPIVVYCRSGARSAHAAQLLRQAGHDVLDIGAIGNW
jgi:rhodanese-related sulfurtransferase